MPGYYKLVYVWSG